MMLGYPQKQGSWNLLEHACRELHRRFKSGDPCHSEELFHAYPALTDHPEVAVFLIAAECASRLERGEPFIRDEWFGRFPQWRDQLAEAFDDRGWREDLSSATVELPRSSDKASSLGSWLPSAERREKAIEPGLLPPHEILEEIGKGAMGVVYRARDLVLDREVALKTIRPAFLADRPTVERFYREARAAALLRHPHIAPIYCIGVHEGQHCFTMPLAAGGTLEQNRGHFSDPKAAADLLFKVARAVHHSHRRGVIHRDLKPGNILLDSAGEPLVADFGLAKFLHQTTEASICCELLGTPAYMAPEQANGDSGAVGPATDVWALGVILFELLAARRPFEGKDFDDLLGAIRTRKPSRLLQLRPDLDPALAAIVTRCLEKKPRKRYAAADDLADDLERFLSGAKPQAALPAARGRRGVLVGVTAFVLVLALLAAVVVRTTAPAAAPPGAPEPGSEQAAHALADVRHKIAEGQSVELLTADGTLAVAPSFLHGDAALTPSRYHDGTLVVRTFDQNVLMQILPHTGCDRYRFIVEMHRGPGAGLRGIFVFATPLKDVPQDCLHYTWALLDDASPIGIHVEANFQWLNAHTTEHLRSVEESWPAKQEWYTLEARVTPQQTSLYLDGKLVKTLSADDLQAGFKRLEQAEPNTPPFPKPNGRGGVGLLLSSGEVSFRRIAFVPTDDK